jgi:hypothetical protein
MFKWASGGRELLTVPAGADAELALGLAEYDPQAATASETVASAAAAMGARIDMDCHHKTPPGPDPSQCRAERWRCPSSGRLLIGDGASAALISRPGPRVAMTAAGATPAAAAPSR